jgi:hypothetical protein
VGNESPLVSAVAAGTAKRVSRFALVLIPNRLSEQSRNDSLLQAAGRPPLPADPYPEMSTSVGPGTADRMDFR